MSFASIFSTFPLLHFSTYRALLHIRKVEKIYNYQRAKFKAWITGSNPDLNTSWKSLFYDDSYNKILNRNAHKLDFHNFLA